MKNFDWSSFSVRILIKAKMDDIYNAFCKASELDRWFTKKATHYNSDKKPIASAEPVQSGCFYTWSWFLAEGVENGKFILANGHDRIQFNYNGDCLVEIKLTEKVGEYTQVDLHQKHIPVDDISKQEIRLANQASWSFYLVNLKSVYEGGLDLRNKDERFNPMVNN